MKKALLTLGLTAVLSCTAFGQAQKGESERTTAEPVVKGKSFKQNSNSRSKGSGTTTEAPLLQAGTNLEAQLRNSIDVRKSAVGDEVVLKTTKSIKQNGEVIVPKGTNLVGRITEVQRKTKESAVSRVGMVFDRLQGKNLDVPLNFSIVSMATAQTATTAGDLFASDITATGGGSAAGRARPASGGGLLGGVGSTVNSTLGVATQTVGSVASSATGTLSQTTGGLGRTVSGLQIIQSANGSASSASTISALGKDVKIEKGTTFQMRVDGSAQNLE